MCIRDRTEHAAILFAQAKLAHYFGNEQEALVNARQSLASYTAVSYTHLDVYKRQLDGQRGAALKQYDACASALMDELGVPPSAETNALYDRILAGAFDRPERVDASLSGVEATPRRAPFQAIAPPAYLAGRSQEVEQLVACLTLSLIHI